MQLDTCYADLLRDTDGRFARAVEAEARAVEVWAGEGFGYLQAYTGDTLEPASRRRKAIALEPMTCPPNAFATGTDVIAIAPGATWSGAWGIAPRVGA